MQHIKLLPVAKVNQPCDGHVPLCSLLFHSSWCPLKVPRGTYSWPLSVTHYHLLHPPCKITPVPSFWIKADSSVKSEHLPFSLQETLGLNPPYSTSVIPSNVDTWCCILTFMCLVILAALGLRCCVQASSSCSKQGLLTVVASLVKEHGVYALGL